MTERIPFPNEIQRPEELLTHWRHARAEVLSILASIPDDQLHTAPGDGSWSAAQIAEHLYLTQNFFARTVPIVLRGKFGVDIAKSQVDHNKIYNKASTPQGVQNPDLVTPEGNWDRARLVKSLDEAMAKLDKVLTGVTADQMRSRGYDHPLEGVVDLLEYAWVLTLHENSHLIAMRAKWGDS